MGEHRTRLSDGTDLAAAWEQRARDWIAWARTPDHDSYWRFHRDLFLELVPPPGRRTLDLGCGEGRLSRDLAQLGHHVVGVDASPTLVAAARQADPTIETHVADAAALPFGAGAFDLVVAFMSLQDVADLDSAVSESARILTGGGRFCVAIVHPLNSAGTFAGDDADSVFTIDGSYLRPWCWAQSVSRDGLEMEFVSAHRPLEVYTEALARTGFLIERLREAAMPDEAITIPRHRRWQRLPLFLHLRALRPER